MEFDLDDDTFEFESRIVKELQDANEVFSDRSIAEDSRKSQELSVAASSITIFYKVGAVTIEKVNAVVFDFKFGEYVDISLIVISMIFLMRYYAYLYCDGLALKYRKMAKSFRIFTLNNRLANAALQEEDEDDRKRASKAHEMLEKFTIHCERSQKVRLFVERLFPAALWVAAVTITIGFNLYARFHPVAHLPAK